MLTRERLETPWLVVVNDDQHYAVWPQVWPLPAGWREVGRFETEEAALADVEARWTDLRPASPHDGPAVSSRDGAIRGDRDDPPPLLERLREKPHPCTVVCRVGTTLDACRAQIQLGWLHVRVEHAAGSTELPVQLVAESVRALTTDPLEGMCRVHVHGTVAVDDTVGVCIMEIEPHTLAGQLSMTTVYEDVRATGIV